MSGRRPAGNRQRTSSVAASRSGERWRSGPGPATRGTQDGDRGARRGGRLERGPQVDAAGGGDDLDRQHAGQQVDRRTQLARRGPAQRHVVLLHRARRDRVDTRRRREPLELGRPSPPGCTARSCAPSRRLGRRRGTAAGPDCASRRGTGPCGARSCSRHRRPGSPGSPARTPAGHRGSCRATRCARRRAPTGCRSLTRARARRRSPRGRGCRGPHHAPAEHSAASTHPAPARHRAGGSRRSASRRAAQTCAPPTRPGPGAGATPAGRRRAPGRWPSGPRCSWQRRGRRCRAAGAGRAAPAPACRASRRCR